MSGRERTRTQEPAPAAGPDSPRLGRIELPEAPKAPAIAVPKGGGALKGIDEQFRVNTATGTASVSIPIALPTGRSGATPALGLAYDSGSGNGPFGLGWSLSVPAVSRRTDRGIPRYRDDDRFVLSGAEELVPALERDATGDWAPVADTRTVGAATFAVERFRPRTEGLMARIERWTDQVTGDVHWRSVSASNVVTLYGRTPESRIADPADPARVFSWLVCESRDQHGEAVRYEYAAEDAVGVDPEAVHERGRLAGPFPQRHLKRVLYGNRTPWAGVDEPSPTEWLFEVVLDYGDHRPDAPAPEPDRPWPVRADPFSTARAGFEVRTRRLCRRVLAFHRFPQELGTPALLTRSTDLTYDEDATGTRLVTAESCGYAPAADGGLERAALPALELAYSPRELRTEVRELGPVARGHQRWVDLDGDGAPGLLTALPGGWEYQRNATRGTLEPPRRVAAMPSASGGEEDVQFVDLAGDGQLDLVTLAGAVPGFSERAEGRGWEAFTPFRSLPGLDWGSPHVRLADLTGDGRADVLELDDDRLGWYRSLGEEGFAAPEWLPLAPDEDRAPRPVHADRRESLQLADMTGDGLVDFVRIRAAEVCYWPNLGHGRFGPRVVMGASPRLDALERFDPARIRLADTDGSGATDLVYLGDAGAEVHLNQAGNAFSPARPLPAVPAPVAGTRVDVADVLGTGTACLVWSTAADGAPARFLDLNGGAKPNLLVRIVNNLGGETRIAYEPSSWAAADDRRAGRPWITRLPFPVHVVVRVEELDLVARSRLVTRHAYHHGAYDGVEREFRGFGLVEQWDTEEIGTLPDDGAAADNWDAASFCPPTLTRSWFHTGAWVEEDDTGARFAQEYWRAPGAVRPELLLPDAALPDGLSEAEARDACRALRGSLLRRETYGLDGTAAAAHPYEVVEQSYGVLALQPAHGGHPGCFLAVPRETLTAHHERRPADPRIQHRAVLAVDPAFGHVLHEATFTYGRRGEDPDLGPDDRAVQARGHAVTTEHDETEALDEPDAWRPPRPAGSRAYELTGPGLDAPAPLTLAAIAALVEGAPKLSPGQPATPGRTERRLIGRGRILYARDDLAGPLPPGQAGRLALVHRTEELALTPELLAEAFADRVDAALLAAAGYAADDAGWWVPSGTVHYSPEDGDDPAQELAHARAHFFLARRFVDPFGAVARVHYDAHDLLVTATEDAAGNRFAARNDYRLLAPVEVTDANGNRTAARVDALGRVTASATMGKAGEGDTVDDPTISFEYGLFEWRDHGRPAFARALARERHGDPDSPRQETLTYSDGHGREIQRKARAEPGPLAPGGPPLPERWVGSGWALLDNKGRPVRRFEPFFSATPAFERRLDGLGSTIVRDPLGRTVALVHPNQTWEKVVRTPWDEATWDVNDTVLEAAPETDPDVGGALARLAPTALHPTWHAARVDGGLGPAERAAAQQAAAHARTPARTWLDALGHVAVTQADNGAAGRFATRFERDAAGDERVVIDAKGRRLAAYVRDLTGDTLAEDALDTGRRMTLRDVTGQTVLTWNARDHRVRQEYDVLRRPLRVWLRTGTGPERLVERLVYGEAHPDAAARNLRGEPWLTLDGAGAVAAEAFDFKGNRLAASRRLLADHRAPVDWAAAEAILGAAAVDLAALEAALAAVLEPEAFRMEKRYDALNRPVALTGPDGSVVLPAFNEANLLERVEVALPGEAARRTIVAGLDYDAKGQRRAIEYPGGVRTDYEHDPLTLRLSRVRTRRGETALQDVAYTWDPMGNLLALGDAAQPTVFFANQVVPASCAYEYDAVYRLVRAEGREHAGQVHPTWDDAGRTRLPHPGDGQAMRRFVEAYEHDEVGNLLRIVHHAQGGDWVRAYDYAEPSNRLTSTTVGGATEAYRHDAHGNVVAMPHLPGMEWDHEDQLSAVDRGGGGRVRYAYDAAGARVRRVVERPNGTRMEERIELDGFEVFRRFDGTGASLRLQRHTLHVTDDQQRVALIETLVRDDATPGFDGRPAVRLQLANHVGSSAVELDDEGHVITYEEYHPYGSTAYQAGRSAAEVSLKRYRHTGKERDEETGFSYHGHRYYACWLGRWTSPDPAGIADGVNVYLYVRGDPVGQSDPTGLWTVRQVAIASAVVGLAVAAIVATGGAAAVGMAVGGAGLTGTAGTLATVGGTILTGALTGGLSGAASSAVAQKMTTGSVDVRQTLKDGAVGALAGAVTAGIGSGISAAASGGTAAAATATRSAAAASAAARTGARGIAARAATRAARGAAMGATGGAVHETTRQAVSGEGFDAGRIGAAAGVGALGGAALEAAAGPAMAAAGEFAYKSGFHAGLSGRGAALTALAKRTGNDYRVYSHGELWKRQFVTVATKDGVKGFYVRSGGGSNAAAGAAKGDYARTMGIEARTPHGDAVKARGLAHPDPTVQKAAKGMARERVAKDPKTELKQNDPDLFKWGDPESKATAQWLGQQGLAPGPVRTMGELQGEMQSAGMPRSPSAHTGLYEPVTAERGAPPFPVFNPFGSTQW